MDLERAGVQALGHFSDEDDPHRTPNSPFQMRELLRAVAIALLGVSSAVNAQVPSLPAVPTAGTCRVYMQDNHARRAAILRETSECMRDFPWNYSDRYTNPVCKHPPPRLVMEVSPYNCPERASEMCALVEAERLIQECYRRAKATQTSQESYQEKLAAFNNLEKQLGALRNAHKDPRRVFWDVVEPRLPTDTKLRLGLLYEKTNSELAKGPIPMELAKSGQSLFVVPMFNRNGDFTQRGASLMQETYDFVYARTIGDKHALMQKYNNPIIGAIQGVAAEEIRRIHGSIIHKFNTEVDGVIGLIISDTAISTSEARPPTPTMPVIRRQQTTHSNDPGCAVLDGPERTDLAINSPEIFEQLVARCRR